MFKSLGEYIAESKANAGLAPKPVKPLEKGDLHFHLTKRDGRKWAQWCVKPNCTAPSMRDPRNA